jgi:hypothetical protein
VGKVEIQHRLHPGKAIVDALSSGSVAVGVNKPREQNLALAINNVCALRVRFPGCALADNSGARGQQRPAVSV